MKKIEELLLKKITTLDCSCWEWNGPIGVDGYGQAYCLGFSFKAHRLFYEVFVGEIPSDLVIDHKCKNRLCVNPEHLEPVTIYENSIVRSVDPFGRNKINSEIKNAQSGYPKYTHCKRGHEYSEENTRILKNGTRRCRKCVKIWGLDAARRKSGASENVARKYTKKH